MSESCLRQGLRVGYLKPRCNRKGCCPTGHIIISDSKVPHMLPGIWLCPEDFGRLLAEIKMGKYDGTSDTDKAGQAA